MVGTTNNPLRAPTFLPVPFQTGPLSSTHHFSLVPSEPIHVLGRDFLEIYQAHISFFLKRKIILQI